MDTSITKTNVAGETRQRSTMDTASPSISMINPPLSDMGYLSLLPPELRQMIYEHLRDGDYRRALYALDMPEIQWTKFSDVEFEQGPLKCLSMTCHQTHHECQPWIKQLLPPSVVFFMNNLWGMTNEWPAPPHAPLPPLPMAKSIIFLEVYIEPAMDVSYGAIIWDLMAQLDDAERLLECVIRFVDDPEDEPPSSPDIEGWEPNPAVSLRISKCVAKLRRQFDALIEWWPELDMACDIELESETSDVVLNFFLEKLRATELERRQMREEMFDELDVLRNADEASADAAA
ncbi:hypothetical protein K461DRAFT_280448 [Myriangium duriaei CBS 260.36]|uniref:F-box domain-containing protein n=1 Tax=Myriangium duriaei CBS 260.36 TaxID=1168546 RepID=A0A9P4J106_9PEZI|nr:hypothetical protein K461DRAFT_280448 [Myriangium duriaei CBS 260.36]